MPPWNTHDILLRFTNPPVTDENGFLQADEEGVINRWDIVNTIEHLPWTTKQLYAKRQAEKASRAKNISAFNGWNDSYDFGGGYDSDRTPKSDLWAKERGYWYHHDGRPFIPIMKNVNRAIRLGKFVARPIGNLLRRSRSFSDPPPPVPPKDEIKPPAKRPLRRRATISDMTDVFLDEDTEDDDLPRGVRCTGTRDCGCWKCKEYTRFLNGRYAVDPNRPYDPFQGGTGVDKYDEEWDDWSKRIDFIRWISRLPPNALDLRRRTRPREAKFAEQAAGHPPARAATAVHAQQTHSTVPPPPAIPVHVSSHKPNSRLINEEQQYWAEQQAQWKAARGKEALDQLREQLHPSPRGRVNDWRRSTHQVQPPRERSKSRHRVSRPVKADGHISDAARPTRRPKAPPADPPSNPAPETRSRHRSRPPVVQQIAAQLEDHDDDPFNERDLERATVIEVYRGVDGGTVPAPVQQKSKTKPTSRPVEKPVRPDERAHVSRAVDIGDLGRARPTDVHRRADDGIAPPPIVQCKPKPKPISNAVARPVRSEERGQVSRFVDIANLTENDRFIWRRAAAIFVEQQACGIEPMSDARAEAMGRGDPRRVVPEYTKFHDVDRVPHPSRRHRHEERARREPLANEVHGASQVPPHYTGQTAYPHPSYSQPPKPSRPAERPLNPDIAKHLPSLPSLSSFPDDTESLRSRAGSRRARVTYTVTPVPDQSNEGVPQPRRARRGAMRSDQSDFDDDSTACEAPRAGDSGWREEWARAQRAAKKKELEDQIADLDRQDRDAAQRDAARDRRRR